MTEEERTRIAEANLGRLLDWIGRIDTKSSVVLGVGTAMLALLASLAPSPRIWTLQTVIFGATGAVCPLASLFFVYAANYPRVKGSSTSLNFFGGISSKTFREYAKAFMDASAGDHLSDVLEQCHRNAEIISQKFSALKWAYRALLVGVVPWILCLYYFRAIGESR